MTIKSQIQVLSEDDLRQRIVIPLLFALGCKDVRDNCGPSEYGKDILYLSRDHFLREKLWGAVILKKDDIGKSGLDNIHRQVSDAINQFMDPDDPRHKVQLQEILVVTAGELTNEAQKYINEQSGKNFPNVHFLNGNRLEFLISQVVVEYNGRTGSSYVFQVDTFGGICGWADRSESGISRQDEGRAITDI